MANIFKEAKKVQRMHKKWDWQKCIQVASKRHKKSGTTRKKKNKANYRQTGKSNAAVDKRIKARRPGARIPAGGDQVTYYERRKNRSDVPGTLTGVSDATLKSALKDRLKQRLGKKLVKQKLSTKVREKKKLGKEITQITREFNRIS